MYCRAAIIANIYIYIYILTSQIVPNLIRPDCYNRKRSGCFKIQLCVDYLGVIAQFILPSILKINEDLNLESQIEPCGFKLFKNLLMLLWLRCQKQQCLAVHTLSKWPGKGKKC